MILVLEEESACALECVNNIKFARKERRQVEGESPQLERQAGQDDLGRWKTSEITCESQKASEETSLTQLLLGLTSRRQVF